MQISFPSRSTEDVSKPRMNSALSYLFRGNASIVGLEKRTASASAARSGRVRHEVAATRSPSASPAQGTGYDEAPTRSPTVATDA